MYYMGFHDLFDHLLDTSKGQGADADVTKGVSNLMQNSSVQSGWEITRRKTDRRASCR